MKGTPEVFAHVLEIVEAVRSWGKTENGICEGEANGVGVAFFQEMATAGAWLVRISASPGKSTSIVVGYPLLPFGKWKAEAELYRKLEAVMRMAEARARDMLAKEEAGNLADAVAMIQSTNRDGI